MSYTPVAVTDDGLRVEGQIYYRRERCAKAVGESVTVLVNLDDREQRYLVTFVHYWLLPTMGFFLPLMGTLLFSLPVMASFKRR